MCELRKAIEYDFDFYYKLKCENEAVYWGGWKSTPVREKLEVVYKKLINCPPPENFLDIVCNDCGQVGYIQYRYHKNIVELSIGILQQYHGKGIATEAIKLACKSFKGKIIAYIREDNVASQKAFKKSGFKKTEYGELRYLENLDRYVCMELWEYIQ